jgi:hypothetical protein
MAESVPKDLFVNEANKRLEVSPRRSVAWIFMANSSAPEQAAKGEKEAAAKEVADNTAAYVGCRLTSLRKQDGSSDNKRISFTI